MRLATLGFLIVVIATIFMVFDSYAETTTIVMPDGSILTCSSDSTGVVVCI
jgi:hypothetical protein